MAAPASEWQVQVDPGRPGSAINNAAELSEGLDSTMAIRIKARAGEGAEQMMRRFKKLCEKEGLTKDIKRKAFYEKPSERRRRASRKNFKRSTMDGPSPTSRANGPKVGGTGGGVRSSSSR